MTTDNWFLVFSAIGLAVILANLIWANIEKLFLTGLSFITLACTICTYQMKTASEISSGSFPFMLSLLLLLCLLALVFKPQEEKEAKISDIRFVLGIITLSCFYLFLANFIGYYTSSILFIGVCASLLGNKRYITLALTSICWCLFVFYVFEKTLSINLPKGLLY